MTDGNASKDNCPGWDTQVIRNSDIELRFKLREEISEELAQSIGEHGVLTPPIVLELTP
jgi:ParB-like chromosome segregation protein Spo0J